MRVMNSARPSAAVQFECPPSQEVEMTSPLRRIRVALSLGAAIVLTCAGALSVGAQTTGVIRGKVIDGATTRPVDGAQVYVAGTELGTLTNSDGQYQFAVRAGTVEVRTRRVGYASTTKQVTVTAGQVTDADITLNKAAIALDAVVVTGTGARRRSASSATPSPRSTRHNS